MQLPELSRILRRFQFVPRSWKKPRREIQPRKITKIRISSEEDRRGEIIFPELFVDDEWQKLYVDGFFATLDRGLVTDKSRNKRLREGWKEWLEDFIKLNKLNVELEKPGQKEEPEKRKKREKPEPEEEAEPVAPPLPQSPKTIATEPTTQVSNE